VPLGTAYDIRNPSCHFLDGFCGMQNWLNTVLAESFLD